MWTFSQRRLDGDSQWKLPEIVWWCGSMKLRASANVVERITLKQCSERMKAASSTDKHCLFMTQQPVCTEPLTEIPIQTAGGVRVWFGVGVVWAGTLAAVSWAGQGSEEFEEYVFAHQVLLRKTGNKDNCFTDKEASSEPAQRGNSAKDWSGFNMHTRGGWLRMKVSVQ